MTPYACTYAFYILIAGPAMTSGCAMNNILRYEGKAFYAMIGLTSGGILNIFLDYLMVRVLQLGIGGAGLATCISQYVSMVILMIPYLRKQTISSFHVRYIAKTAEPYQRIIANGMPSLCRQGLNSVSTMVLNTSAAAFGDPAVAAISIVNRIVNFLFCVAVGIGTGFPACILIQSWGKTAQQGKGRLLLRDETGGCSAAWFSGICLFQCGSSCHLLP